ncbi:MAG: glycosyltransferase [bacterium]
MIKILLSTYNGESYIREQLESYTYQTYKDFEVLVRDDGSTDKTVEIIKNFRALYNIKLVCGENKGVNGSFFELLSIAGESQYYAFSDQDDYWLPEKLNRAVSTIKSFESNRNMPFLYCSSFIKADRNLIPIKHVKRNIEPSFSNSLLQSIASGLTIVINNSARELLLSHLPDMKKICMYDWWFALVISAFGVVYYDQYPAVTSSKSW